MSARTRQSDGHVVFERGVRHSQQETARAMGITRQRVNQIERSALAKLRRALEERGLKLSDFI